MTIDERKALRCLVFAYQELNAIRARDGVPYTHTGFKSDVDEKYWSDLVDSIDLVVVKATGHTAHCHPLLYTGEPL